jgi:hypothetical protein
LTDWHQVTDVLRDVQLIGGLTEWGELMSVILGILVPLDEEASALFPHAGLSTQKNQLSANEEAGTKFQEWAGRGSFIGNVAISD